MVHVVDVAHHVGQQAPGLAALLAQRDGEHHPADDQQGHGDGGRGETGHPASGRPEGVALGAHARPIRYPTPRTVRTTSGPSLRRR